jgi:hypothetical protein
LRSNFLSFFSYLIVIGVSPGKRKWIPRIILSKNINQYILLNLRIGYSDLDQHSPPRRTFQLAACLNMGQNILSFNGRKENKSCCERGLQISRFINALIISILYKFDNISVWNKFWESGYTWKLKKNSTIHINKL